MKLIADILTYGLGNVLPKVLGFLLLPWFTRYLSPEDYGIVALLGWAGIVLTPLMSAGLGVGLAPQYFRAEDSLRRREVIWTAIALVVIASAVVFTLLCAGEQEIHAWLGVPPRARAGFRLGVGALAMGALLVPLQGNLQFAQRARAFTAVTLIATLATLGLSALLVIGLRRGVAGWFEAALGGQGAAVLLAAWFNRDLAGPRWNFEIARGLAVSGAILMPTTFLIFLLQHGNKWLLQEYRGLGELGVYNLALNLGLVMNLVVVSIQSAWFPAVMAQRPDRAVALQHNVRMFVRLALGLGVLNVLFAVAARPLVELMTAPAFHAAYRLVALNAHAHVWAALFYVAIIPLYFDGRENQQTGILLIAAMAYAALSVWLVPRWGGLGCAIATAAGFALAALLAVVLSVRRDVVLARMFRAQAARLTAIGGLWLVGGALAAIEMMRPEQWPGYSIAALVVCLLMPWLLLGADDRAGMLAAFAQLRQRLRT